MGKWSAIKTKGPSPRCNHAMATVDDRVFVIGGRAGEATLFNDVHVFDTNQETWSAPAITGPAPEARDFHTVVTFAHYIVLFGGAQEIEATDTNIHFNDVWALDTRAFKWTKVACRCVFVLFCWFSSPPFVVLTCTAAGGDRWRCRERRRRRAGAMRRL
jgi:N-acetylneuraminic acid mutarotase